MSKGVLLFALNNSKIDYTKLAVFAASRIKRFLGVPVTVVTDSRDQLLKNDVNKVVDTIVDIEDNTNYTRRFYDGAESFTNLQWKNTARYTSFELSPYDETLVLDVDYIINSPTLSYCWDTPYEFLIYEAGVDLTRTETVKYVSEYSIPFYWATVFYFKKTNKVKALFELIQYIKDNWEYHRLLYQLPDKKFRNDFAFSIAIHMLSGFFDKEFVNHLPGKLFYTADRSYVLDISSNYVKLLLENNNCYIPVKVSSLDVHVMNKFSLIRALENV
jgi:hypothetical protein